MTDYEEYMKTLEEQIQNKRARVLVADEIRNHMEEQAAAYEAEGMSTEEAKKEAVRQMGDPVETGCALNRIHRPAFPWKLFVLAVFLTAASMLISFVIAGKTESGTSQAKQIGSLLMINMVSFGIIFVIMYLDYTWLFLHIRAVAVCYLICLCLVWSGVVIGNYQTALLASYSMQVLLPVIYAGIIYQYRGKEFGGILKATGWIFVPFLVLTVMSTPRSTAAVLENAVVCLLLLVAAILHGIFGEAKKRYLIKLAVLAAILSGAGAVLYYPFFENGYVSARLDHMSESGYQNGMIKAAVEDYSLFGNRTLLMQGHAQDGEYLLGNIFCYFGIIAGVFVIAAFVWFLLQALRQSLMQSSRMGFLLGMACSIALIVRVMFVYVAVNFGCAVTYTVAVPFFSTNLMLAAVNGIYVGLLFCVLRNKMILKETCVERKNTAAL